jgi:Histidine kinase-, DNA gyrase B-, and HSP90-like ATPase
MAKAEKRFTVDTSPTKAVVVDSITRDATNEECIFDLIDNSIDAARNAIFSHISPKVRTELPDSYAGYEIKLHLSGTSLKIADNCGGISIDNLKKSAFRFGEQSEQRMGIGAFGVGLNRAMFRLGSVGTLTTDTGRERAEVSLDKETYEELRGWTLPAQELSSTGKAGTTIEIGRLPPGTSNDFGDPKWVMKLEHEIARRYGRFIEKDLAIWVGGTKLTNEEVQIRENGTYEVQEKIYRDEDVLIHVRYGQHKLHKFPFEAGHSEEQNRRLTTQYGWTILCNDRAVIMSDRSHKTGWEITKFHSDFYGFVGYVNFICQDPLKLPWKTTKTDVDLNNHAYQMALKDMRHFAEEWRSQANKRKHAKNQPKPPPPKPKGKPAKSPTKGKKKSSPPPKPTTKPDHNQFRTVLPLDIDEALCFDKHLALVRQAKGLDIVTFSYPGLALLRMLFEASTVKYMERISKLADLRTFALDRRKKDGWKPSAEQEKNATITMDEMLAFYHHDTSIWGAANGAYMRHIVAKMTKHQKTFNSALHHPYQIISYTQALQIRDEALPLLRHLIEKK